MVVLLKGYRGWRARFCIVPQSKLRCKKRGLGLTLWQVEGMRWPATQLHRKTNCSLDNNTGFNRVLRSAVSLNVPAVMVVMVVVHVFH